MTSLTKASYFCGNGNVQYLHRSLQYVSHLKNLAPYCISNMNSNHDIQDAVLNIYSKMLPFEFNFSNKLNLWLLTHLKQTVFKLTGIPYQQQCWAARFHKSK